jgi:hypothetical protein
MQEISDLRRSLNTEVDSLRGEFVDLKAALKQQLDLTAQVATIQVRMGGAGGILLNWN